MHLPSLPSHAPMLQHTSACAVAHSPWRDLLSVVVVLTQDGLAAKIGNGPVPRKLRDAPFVQIPLGVTEDRLVGTVDIEASMKVCACMFDFDFFEALSELHAGFAVSSAAAWAVQPAQLVQLSTGQTEPASVRSCKPTCLSVAFASGTFSCTGAELIMQGLGTVSTDVVPRPLM